MRRSTILVPIALAVATALVLSFGTGPVGVSRPSGSVSPDESAAPASGTTTPPQLTLLGPGYRPDVVRSPTRMVAQSKLWYADDHWWGILVTPNGEARIFRLDIAGRSWQLAGPLVDERNDTFADALSEGERLVVVTAGPNPASAADALRLVRYQFDAAGGRYVLDRDFPVQISAGGVRSAMVARDSTGKLWVSYLAEGRLVVDHSTTDDHLWRGPFQPTGGASALTVSQAAIVAEPGSIAIVWTAAKADGLFVTRHDDADPDDVWRETRLDLQGLAGVSDQLSARSVPARAGSRLLVALRTNLDREANVNRQAPMVLLVVIEPDGSFRPHLFGRVSERHGRPAILVDAGRDRLYMAASGPSGTSGRAIYYKDTALSDISFGPGLGAPLALGLDPLRVDNTTTTKQPLDGLPSLVVLGSDDQTGNYVTGILGIGGSIVGEAPEPSPQTLVAPEAVVDESFDPWPIDRQLANGWAVVAGGGPETATIVRSIGRAGMSAQLTTGAKGERVRACRPFPPASTRPLSVSVDIRLAVPGRSDAVVAVRGDGLDAASVRFDDVGVLAYYDGPTKVRTTVTFRPRVWYRTFITLDPRTRTYALEIHEVAGGRSVLHVTGLGWRSTEPTLLDELCINAPVNVPGTVFLFDDVVVRR